MRTRPVTRINPDLDSEAAQSLVAFQPSKLVIVLAALGGISLGITIGWYLAGGAKIEEHYYANQDPKRIRVERDEPSPDDVIMEIVEDVA